MKTAKLIIDGKEISVQIEETELKKLEVEKGKWKAEAGDEYFHLWSDGGVGGCTDNGGEYDNFRHLIGNYFKTKEQVESYKQFLQAVGEIKQYIAENFGEFRPDWGEANQRKYYLYCNHESLKWESNFGWTNSVINIIPLVESDTTAQAIIYNCHKQLSIIREFTKDNNY